MYEHRLPRGSLSLEVFQGCGDVALRTWAGGGGLDEVVRRLFQPYDSVILPVTSPSWCSV